MKKTACARELRRDLTPAERLLWRHLRGRRFAHYKFRRQHHPGPWIVDFACCEAHLVIELNGGQHAERYAYDTRRTRWLEAHGWQVLRFWNNEVEQHEEAVLMKILEVLQRLTPSPRVVP